MSCKYGYYKKTEKNKPKLYCSITEDMCIYSKLCLKPSVNKYIFNDKAEECMIKKENEKKTIPNGSYLVRFIKKGFAYVELTADKVIKVNCSNLDGISNYIYLKDVDGTYVGSLTPFNNVVENPKTNNKKRKNRVEKGNAQKDKND